MTHRISYLSTRKDFTGQLQNIKMVSAKPYTLTQTSEGQIVCRMHKAHIITYSDSGTVPAMVIMKFTMLSRPHPGKHRTP